MGHETHLCSVETLLLGLPPLPRSLDLGLRLGFPLALRREVLFAPPEHALAVLPALVRDIAAVRDLGGLVGRKRREEPIGDVIRACS